MSPIDSVEGGSMACSGSKFTINYYLFSNLFLEWANTRVCRQMPTQTAFFPMNYYEMGNHLKIEGMSKNNLTTVDRLI
jgi:hypothetical protein